MVYIQYFVSTDWHIEHANIIDYENRPINHTELLIKHHNEVMTKYDVLICLGDTIFGGNRQQLGNYLKQFICRDILLIRGNHDKFKDEIYLNMGFAAVFDSVTIKGVKLSHTPSQLSVDDTINVHGHFHSKGHRYITNYWYNLDRRHHLLAVENTNYYPISLGDLKNEKYATIEKDYLGKIIKFSKKKEIKENDSNTK